MLRVFGAELCVQGLAALLEMHGVVVRIRLFDVRLWLVVAVPSFFCFPPGILSAGDTSHIGASGEFFLCFLKGEGV